MSLEVTHLTRTLTVTHDGRKIELTHREPATLTFSSAGMPGPPGRDSLEGAPNFLLNVRAILT